MFRQRLEEALQAEGAVCVRTRVLGEYTQNSKEFGVLDWGLVGALGWGREWRLDSRQMPGMESAMGYPGLDQG